MPRYKAIVEYDGTNFEGWQSQPNGNTIQQFIEDSFIKISLKKIKIFGSGRTDSGVHALGQVFHFDYDEELDCEKIKVSCNHFLRDHLISILSLEKTDSDFDARRDATMRTYLYKIVNRKSPLALSKNKAWHLITELDLESMKQAAKTFLGQHDFSTFRSSSCEAKSPVRDIKVSNLSQVNEEIIYEIQSRSFLQHQVRSMVGAIKLVGEGKWTLTDIKSALDSKDRKKCAPPAPSCGLYLKEVKY